jgi:D-alanyl-D-alanine carboxypeptidase
LHSALPVAPDAVSPPVRSTAAQRRQLLDQSHTLGVPRDYARVHALRAVREASALAFIGYDIHDRAQWLQPRAARAWFALRQAAAIEQVELQVVSAFRSIEYQLGILRRKRERGQDIEDILRVSAAPGYSEHHSGRALDLTTPGFAALEEDFEKSPAFRWLQRHGAKHGFALSFPRGNRHGIAYEPWHWCWHAARA